MVVLAIKNNTRQWRNALERCPLFASKWSSGRLSGKCDGRVTLKIGDHSEHFKDLSVMDHG